MILTVSEWPVGKLQGQSGPVKTTLSQYEYKLVYFGNPFYFANISAPQNHTEMILYSEFTDGSQFSKEKNGLLFLGCSENQETIKNINHTFFTGHPFSKSLCFKLLADIVSI